MQKFLVPEIDWEQNWNKETLIKLVINQLIQEIFS
jgi:hypothetical protein